MFKSPKYTIMALDGKLPMARSKAAVKKPTLEVAMKAVEEAFRVGIKDLMSLDKREDVSVPRGVAIFHAHYAGNVSFTEIARFMGWKDHSAAGHASAAVCERLVALEENNPASAEERRANAIYRRRFELVGELLKQQGFVIDLPEFCVLQEEAEKLMETKRKAKEKYRLKAEKRRAEREGNV
ncbi:MULTISPECIES: helix-turn-helix domain-containing protein [unclassified Pannonibacter]|uniref:helix-turn-helix domain-containing protein n=1 Tax=unclassified Pannonibacter TaxID=2627228 RepID=UPI001647DB4F|nr:MULTISPECIES: helix-turn-helix domain-containing protein [unclassified Pannonibacter]